MTVYGIVAGGPRALLPSLKEASVDCWIGCDRGGLAILDEGLPLYLAIGDFDSVSFAERQLLKKKAIHFEAYPSDKDDSDLELAIKSIDYTAKDKLILFGTTGGRIDHMLTNIALLKKLAKNGVDAEIMDRFHTMVIYLPGTHNICVPKERYVSLLPMTDKVTGVTLKGFQYPLTNRELEDGSSLTLSNHILNDKGSISFTTGILMIVSAEDNEVS